MDVSHSSNIGRGKARGRGLPRSSRQEPKPGKAQFSGHGVEKSLQPKAGLSRGRGRGHIAAGTLKQIRKDRAYGHLNEEDRKLYQGKLNRILSEKKLMVAKVFGDSNCIPSAIACQVTGSATRHPTQQEVRVDLANEFLKARTEAPTNSLICALNTEGVETIRADKEWLDAQSSAMLTARKYNRNVVHIFPDQNSKPTVQVYKPDMTIEHSFETDNDAIYLIHDGYGHYNAARPGMTVAPCPQQLLQEKPEQPIDHGHLLLVDSGVTESDIPVEEPTTDFIRPTQSEKDNQYIDKRLSTAFNKIDRDTHIQQYPRKFFELIRKNYDEIMKLGCVHHNNSIQKKVHSRFQSYFEKAFTMQLKLVKAGVNVCNGRSYIDDLGAILKHSDLFAKYNDNRLFGKAALHQRTTDLIKSFIETELNYLKKRVHYRDKRGTDWSINTLERLIKNKYFHKFMSDDDIRILNLELTELREALCQKTPGVPKWWIKHDYILDTNFEEAASMIASTKSPRPFYTRFVGDILGFCIQESIEKCGAEKGGSIINQTLFLEAMYELSQKFSDSLKQIVTVKKRMTLLLSSITKRILIDCQDTYQHSELMNHSRKIMINRLAEEGLLDDDCIAIWRNYQGVTIEKHSESSLSFYSVSNDIDYFFKHRNDDEKGAYARILILLNKEDEIRHLNNGKNLVHRLNDVKHCIYDEKFKPALEHMKSVYQTHKSEKGEYMRTCREMEKYRQTCVDNHLLTVALEERAATLWQMLICRSFGVDVTHAASHKSVNLYHEQKLTILRALAPELPLTTTRTKVKAELCNMLNIALNDAANFNILPSSMDSFCEWYEKMPPGMNRSELEVNRKLNALVKAWKELPGAKRNAFKVKLSDRGYSPLYDSYKKSALAPKPSVSKATISPKGHKKAAQTTAPMPAAPPESEITQSEKSVWPDFHSPPSGKTIPLPSTSSTSITVDDPSILQAAEQTASSKIPLNNRQPLPQDSASLKPYIVFFNTVPLMTASTTQLIRQGLALIQEALDPWLYRQAAESPSQDVKNTINWALENFKPWLCSYCVTAQNSLADFAPTSLQPSKTVEKCPESAVLPVKYEQLRYCHPEELQLQMNAALSLVTTSIECGEINKLFDRLISNQIRNAEPVAAAQLVGMRECLFLIRKTLGLKVNREA